MRLCHTQHLRGLGKHLLHGFGIKFGIKKAVAFSQNTLISKFLDDFWILSVRSSPVSTMLPSGENFAARTSPDRGKWAEDSKTSENIQRLKLQQVSQVNAMNFMYCH